MVCHSNEALCKLIGEGGGNIKFFSISFKCVCVCVCVCVCSPVRRLIEDFYTGEEKGNETPGK